MTLPLYGVYGVSGFGREAMPLARDAVASISLPTDRVVFIDDNPEAELNGWVSEGIVEYLGRLRMFVLLLRIVLFTYCLLTGRALRVLC
jgi:hypothetical protein